MIETLENPVQIEKSFEGKQNNFSIDSSAKIFRLLVKQLYQDGYSSVVREITCNAIDAEIEKGIKNPVPQLFLKEGNKFSGKPTELTIQDRGVGISPERISKIFIVLGNSTKENTNAQIGGYGIGSKSPFKIVDAFEVITIHKKIKYHYIMQLDEISGAKCILVSETPSLELSGTSVVIKTFEDNAHHEFYKATKTQLAFINYKLNGLYFPSLAKRAYYENKDFLLFDPKTINKYNLREFENSLLIGPINYKIKTNINLYSQKDYGFLCIYKFNVGQIMPVASREDVDWSKNTYIKLNQKIEICEKKIETIVKKLLFRLKNSYTKFNGVLLKAEEVSNVDIQLVVYKSKAFVESQIIHNLNKKYTSGRTQKINYTDQELETFDIEGQTLFGVKSESEELFKKTVLKFPFVTNTDAYSKQIGSKKDAYIEKLFNGEIPTNNNINRFNTFKKIYSLGKKLQLPIATQLKGDYTRRGKLERVPLEIQIDGLNTRGDVKNFYEFQNLNVITITSIYDFVSVKKTLQDLKIQSDLHLNFVFVNPNEVYEFRICNTAITNKNAVENLLKLKFRTEELTKSDINLLTTKIKNDVLQRITEKENLQRLLLEKEKEEKKEQYEKEKAIREKKKNNLKAKIIPYTFYDVSVNKQFSILTQGNDFFQRFQKRDSSFIFVTKDWFDDEINLKHHLCFSDKLTVTTKEFYKTILKLDRSYFEEADIKVTFLEKDIVAQQDLVLKFCLYSLLKKQQTIRIDKGYKVFKDTSSKYPFLETVLTKRHQWNHLEKDISKFDISLKRLVFLKYADVFKEFDSMFRNDNQEEFYVDLNLLPTHFDYWKNA